MSFPPMPSHGGHPLELHMDSLLSGDPKIVKN